MMNRRKEITNEYKERKLSGGVYKITNTVTWRYLINHAVNLKSVQNAFQFATTTGSAMHHKLQKDWKEMGAKAFVLEILEELEQKPEQSREEFVEDLKILEQLCRAGLDLAKEY